MPKRKRAASEECRPPPPPSSVPLTAANLGRLQEALSPAAMAGGSTSASRSTTSTTTRDDREKLRCYRIHVDTDRALPALLRRHIDDVIRRPRNPAVASSPNARHIVQRRRVAAHQSEANARRYIEPYLLPSGEADMDERSAAVPLITQKAELLLNAFFLPPAPSTTVTNTWKKLEQPKPDSCVGYVTQRDAIAAGCTAPFTQEEEDTLNNYVLTKDLYMPFLTCQWKPAAGSDGFRCAQNQSARDGSAIVKHLYDLYHVAYGTTPSVVDTCHFSIACDVSYVEIWVHWREGPDYYMEQVINRSLREEEDMLRVRGIIRNIQEYAVNERLQSVRAAVARFALEKAKKNGRSYPAVRDPDSSADSASPLPLPTPVASVVMRPPLSVTSEPVMKRRRMDSDSGFEEGET